MAISAVFLHCRRRNGHCRRSLANSHQLPTNFIGNGDFSRGFVGNGEVCGCTIGLRLILRLVSQGIKLTLGSYRGSEDDPGAVSWGFKAWLVAELILGCIIRFRAILGLYHRAQGLYHRVKGVVSAASFGCIVRRPNKRNNSTVNFTSQYEQRLSPNKQRIFLSSHTPISERIPSIHGLGCKRLSLSQVGSGFGLGLFQGLGFKGHGGLSRPQGFRAALEPEDPHNP